MRKKGKRFISALLACALMISIFPFAAFADEDNVASFNNTEYATLEAAVKAVRDTDGNTGTITLLKDVTLNNAIILETGDNITIEGDGHEIKFDNTKTQGYNSAFNGTNSSTNGEGLVAGTKLTVNDVTFTGDGNASQGFAVVIGANSFNTVVTMTNCKFNNLYAGVYSNGVSQTAEFDDEAPVISITDCEYQDTQYGYSVDETTAGMIPGATDTTYEGNTGAEQDQEIWTNTVYATSNSVQKAYKDLQEAINNADDNTTVVVAPGEYDGNITFGGKSLTIQAQYPAYKDGVQETDGSKLSKFTGTFNTYGTDSNSFNADQTIIIDGFALSGNGLKIGNQNYNSVGNLEVRHCTMTFGNNSDQANTNNYAGLNYFVKTGGNSDSNFASVTVEDNYVSGTPDTNIFPIQLWDVDEVVVRNNVLELTNATDKIAISISKISENATVDISNNTITGSGPAIDVTTWQLGGQTNGNATFTGTVSINNNTLGSTVGEGQHPIFVGDNGADNYGTMSATVNAAGNTNNGDVVVPYIGLTDGSLVSYFTATFNYNNGEAQRIISAVASNDEATITTPAAPSRNGYTFRGWEANGERYSANATVTLTGDTVFNADWKSNAPFTPTYLINKDVDKHGEIATEYASAADETIVITVTPDEGYMLDELTVTTKGGKDVELAENTDGTYSFVMPNSEVTVKATFVEDPDYVEPTPEPEPTPDPTPSMPFTDVNEGDWSYDVVQYAYDNGLMTGTSATTFEPNTSTTRGMIVAVLNRLEGGPTAEAAGFTDVNAGDWYADAVNWAASVGIVNGFEDNTFRANDPITREQMAAILYNYADYKGYDVSERADLSSYADANSISSWALDTLEWANAEGLITGMSADTIAPQGQATRAQVAAMFQRFLIAEEQ